MLQKAILAIIIFTKIIELKEPWGSSFINNNEIIITEKSGKIKIVNIISKEVSEIKHNLNFLEVGQGGLLDIIHQDNYSMDFLFRK